MSEPSKPAPSLTRGRTLSFGYGRVVSALRVVIVVLWIGGAAFAVHEVRPLQTGSSVSGLLSTKSPAIEAELTSVNRFAIPLLAQAAVVQHRQGGLSPLALVDAARGAAELDLHRTPSLDGIAGAIPVSNTGGLFPSSRQRNTTVVTYLFFRPSVGASTQQTLTERYGHTYLGSSDDSYVGATGSLIDEAEQGNVIGDHLHDVEVAAIILIVLVVGLSYRSVLAPVVTLATAGVAYLVSQRLLQLTVEHLGVVVPAEVGPIISVLLLGVATDYAVFFLGGYRDRRRSRSSHALQNTIADVAPSVFIAGLTVSAGVAMIAFAHLRLFADLAPSLAVTVAVTMLVAVTFTPALIGLLGRATYWPAGLRVHDEGDVDPMKSARGRLMRVVVLRGVAVVLLLASAAALVYAALPIRRSTVALNEQSDLPSTSSPVRAAGAAGAGFTPGIVGPTVVLVSRKGIGAQRAALGRLQTLLGEQPGVAGTIGPSDNPAPEQVDLFVSKDSDIARFLLVLDSTPYNAAAIATLRRIEDRSAALVARSGIGPAQVSYAGDTAIAQAVSASTRDDLLRVGLLALGVNVLLLLLFLRSIIAALFLGAASALTVAAAFGITVFVFPEHLGGPGFTFFVPLAVEVLLISFGTDYNLFLVGKIWHLSADRPIREAVARATAAATGPINIAGLTLAGSFAMLAIIDLDSFHQFATAMAIGLLLDTFIVRLLLVPAGLALLGRTAGWPKGAPRRSPAPLSRKERRARVN